MTNTAMTTLVKRNASFRTSARKDLAKRIFDILVSLIILPIVAVIVAIAYVIVRQEGSSGFFGHTRIGRRGVAFKCWKIRTMVPDAEERLQILLANDPSVREEWEQNRKLRNDPRVTRMGHFLRKASIDELPQIWNVLKGEMSLVGPRPVTEAELECYGSAQHIYKTMRPGVTGLWQVSGRNDVSYDRRIQLDKEYGRTSDLRTDLRILVQTVLVVLRRTGC